MDRMNADEYLLKKNINIVDDMNGIVICRHCEEKEYYGKMTWLNGKSMCRECYKVEYENTYKVPYTYDDKEYTQEEYKELERGI